jgi:hypothetical protein
LALCPFSSPFSVERGQGANKRILGYWFPQKGLSDYTYPPYAQFRGPLLRSLRMKRFGRPALPFDNLPSVFLPLPMCYCITHIDRTW